MSEACTHRLNRGLLAGKAHGEKADRPFAAVEQGPLLRHQQPVDETLAEAFVGMLHAGNFDDVRADTENHRVLASFMRRFISTTALFMPSKTERATMEWPMLSSTISGIAATC